MQFNSHADKQDIISDITFRTGASLSEYTLNDRTRNANTGYHKLVALIQAADARWTFDDANNTTLPVATTDLVQDQKDYGLTDEMLTIDRVEVLDSNGIWHLLDPIDRTDITVAIDEYQKVSGTPNEYDKLARTLLLYPPSSVDISGGLRVYFSRPAAIFDVSDTTKVPGVDEMWHPYISMYASMVYVAIYKKDRLPGLLQEMADMQKSIQATYARRARDEKVRLTARPISHR